MTLKLDWTGRDVFINEPLRQWKVDGEPAGLTRTAGDLTFATVFGAGHMVRAFKSIDQRLVAQISCVGRSRSAQSCVANAAALASQRGYVVRYMMPDLCSSMSVLRSIVRTAPGSGISSSSFGRWS